MKVLFLSNLYPNSQEPTRATFNKQKIKHLKGLCEVVIVAPVLWFPLKSIFDKKLKKIPLKEKINGVEVYHPRVFYFPKFFRFAYGMLFYLSIRSFVKGLNEKYDFDAIYSSWVYPDGFAGMRLAKLMRKPFVVEALGSDVNMYCKTLSCRKIIKKVFLSAAKVITVSRDLKDKIADLGVPKEKISVIYSGIDHDLFYPADKSESRNRLKIPMDDKIVLFVGNLVRLKGVDLFLKALETSKNKNWKAVIVGDGELSLSLQRMAKKLQLTNRVKFVGPCPHEDISLWINASDVLCLPSLSEGVPNVILEGWACGTPVVASDVGGVSEVFDDSNVGELIEPNNVEAIARGIENVLSKEWDKNYIYCKALSYSWNNTAEKIFGVIKESFDETSSLGKGNRLICVE